jgi:tRNA(Ile)-lysidine synthase
MLSIQDLSPRWARFCLDVEKFIREELGLDLSGSRVLLAVSGGADSTALLTVLSLLQDRMGFSFSAAHLNHMLRPEADREEEFVKGVCRGMGVVCRTGKSRVPLYARRMNIGFEQAAREMRYRFLFGLAEKTGIDYVFTAHHLNDLAEDVLMRLIRGTGWPALAGMSGRNGILARPLLQVQKSDLYAFLQEAGQEWMEDASNLDQSYLRNRVRHEILPLFLRENPGFLGQIGFLWRQGNMDRDFFERQLSGITGPDFNGEIVLSKATLKSMHPALRFRAYKSALERLGPGQALSRNIFDLDRIWKSGRGGKTVQFPGRKTAVIKAGDVIFRERGNK